VRVSAFRSTGRSSEEQIAMFMLWEGGGCTYKCVWQWGVLLGCEGSVKGCVKWEGCEV